MISGTIQNQRAFLPLRVQGPEGNASGVDFVLDAGFTGTITLPEAMCIALKLPVKRSQSAGLADGSHIVLDVYEAQLLWDGAEQQVEVLAMDSAPLLGMTALEGYDVRLQVVDNGLLTVEAL